MPLSRALVTTQTILAVLDQSFPGAVDTLFVHIPISEQISVPKGLRTKVTSEISKELSLGPMDRTLDFNKSIHEWCVQFLSAKNSPQRMEKQFL